jgi:5-methyltetrahydropteroyltriglutamate--homocysteine methyltransferase
MWQTWFAQRSEEAFMTDLAPITPTTVGSYPRPATLFERVPGERASVVRFTMDGDALREAQDEAVRGVIRDQEEAGLELIGDGEQRRTNFINHILASWDGIDFEHPTSKTIRRGHLERLVPTIRGQVTRREAAAVEDIKFLKANTSKPVKIDVPGPMTIVDTTFDAAYGDEVALAMDAAVALNAEMRELQDAGADVIQIDEPAMTRWHEKVADYGAKALDRAIEGITVPTIVHLCYGYPGFGGQQHEYTYPELLDMLMETRISGFSVEFARSAYPAEVLRHAEGRIVMLGCIHPGDTPLEPMADVVDLVRQVLVYVAPENLWLAPDCGLMTISRELALAKSRLLVDTANTARATL